MWVQSDLSEDDIQANVTNYTLSTAVLYNLKRFSTKFGERKNSAQLHQHSAVGRFCTDTFEKCFSMSIRVDFQRLRAPSLLIIHLETLLRKIGSDSSGVSFLPTHQSFCIHQHIEEENVEMSGLQEGRSQIHISHLDRKLSNHGGRNTIIYFNLENPFYHPLPSGFSYNHFRVNLTMTYKVQDTCC